MNREFITQIAMGVAAGLVSLIADHYWRLKDLSERIDELEEGTHEICNCLGARIDELEAENRQLQPSRNITT